MITIERDILGFTDDGCEIVQYTATNSHGAWVKLLNLGATITGIGVPDKNGVIDDIALGYKEWGSYQGDGAAMGKSVGRCANRIANAGFVLDGKEYRLSANVAPNALHGGPTGFQNRVWDSCVEDSAIVFSYISADGEEGYPAKLSVKAIYSWSDECDLSITYRAESDGATVVNLTNHVYFNLKGDGNGLIEDHKLYLNASKWLPTTEQQIPTGEIVEVAGTPMDFLMSTPIGDRIDSDFEALKIGRGYDHCWVVDNYEGGLLNHVATLSEDSSGRVIEIKSTQPGVQIYTGNWLEGSPEGKNGLYVNRSGVAIECQNFPNAVNQPNFPSPILREGDNYSQQIIFTFKNM